MIRDLKPSAFEAAPATTTYCIQYIYVYKIPLFKVSSVISPTVKKSKNVCPLAPAPKPWL